MCLRVGIRACLARVLGVPSVTAAAVAALLRFIERLSKIRVMALDIVEVRKLQRVPVHGVADVVAHVERMVSVLRHRRYDLLDMVSEEPVLWRALYRGKDPDSSANSVSVANADDVIVTMDVEATPSRGDGNSGDGGFRSPTPPLRLPRIAEAHAGRNSTPARAPTSRPQSSPASRRGDSFVAAAPAGSVADAAVNGSVGGGGDAKLVTPQPPSRPTVMTTTTPSLRSSRHLLVSPSEFRAVAKVHGTILSPEQKAVASVARHLDTPVGMDSATAVEADAVNSAFVHFRQRSSLAVRSHAGAADLEAGADDPSLADTAGRMTRVGLLDDALPGRSLAANWQERDLPAHLRSVVALLDGSSVAAARGDDSSSGGGPSFERDHKSFCRMMEHAVLSLGRLLLRQVVASKSSTNAILLVFAVSSAPLFKRTVLRQVVDALHVHCVQQFERELDATVSTLRSLDVAPEVSLDPASASASPVTVPPFASHAPQQRLQQFRNWPPFAGRAAWARANAIRIRSSVALLQSIGGSAVVTPAVLQASVALCSDLDAFQQRCRDDWEQQAIQGLSVLTAPLLLVNRDANTVTVNFSASLETLIQEVRYFHALRLPVSTLLSDVWQRGVDLLSTKSWLVRMLQELQALENKVTTTPPVGSMFLPLLRATKSRYAVWTPRYVVRRASLQGTRCACRR